MQKVEKLLNRLTTVLVIVCVLICLVLCTRIIQGQDASLMGFRIYHILTGSMEPTIPTGSNILVKETDPDKLQVGDIITFRSEQLSGAANTHRITHITTDEAGRKCFITKGDANNVEDSAFVYPEDIKGKVVFHLNIAGFSMFFSFVQTKMGFVTVIIMPLMVLSWWFMRDFRKQVKEMAQQHEEEQQASPAEQTPDETAPDETTTKE